jgi:hypothetical protein
LYIGVPRHFKKFLILGIYMVLGGSKEVPSICMYQLQVVVWNFHTEGLYAGVTNYCIVLEESKASIWMVCL